MSTIDDLEIIIHDFKRQTDRNITADKNKLTIARSPDVVYGYSNFQTNQQTVLKFVTLRESVHTSEKYTQGQSMT